jgi:adenosylcobinamide kinase/adenosylcobinamide-phosphate guanylyltransferase
VRTLVLGGIRSGKSHWAETVISQSEISAPCVRYIATGVAPDNDDAWARRVADHRDRRPPTWHTVESVDVAGSLRSDPGTPTIVDDLGGWLTAVLDRHGWTGAPIDAEVDDLVAAVDGTAADLVLVSPEVGLTVIPATESGRRFADELGVLNQRLADRCQQVVLVVAGQPLWIKRCIGGSRTAGI